MNLFVMLDELSRREIRFVLIGAMAAIAHGSSYNTNDLDVCYDTAEDNLTKLVELLNAWRAYPRGSDQGLPWILDARTFRTNPIQTLRTSLGDIDLLDRVEPIGDYNACLAVSEHLMVGTHEIPVLGLRALIQAKRTVGRPKDQLHILELETIRRKRGD